MSSSTLTVSSFPPPSPSHAPAPAPLPKPTQVKFYRAAQMALFAHIAVFPPLGQVTVASPSRDPVSSYSPACIHLTLTLPLDLSWPFTPPCVAWRIFFFPVLL